MVVRHRRTMVFSVQHGLVLFTCLCSVLCDQLDLNNYVKLPKIYEYDDFQSCRRRFKSFVYCVSISTLQPDTANAVWNNISHLRSDPRNFPHDRLERGLCINEYDHGVNHDDRLIDIAATYLNRQIYDRYGLNSRTEIEACWTDDSFNPRRTTGEYFFFAISLGLLVTIMFATWKDVNTDSREVFVEVFSIKKNIQRLRKPPNPNTLPYLEGLRAIGMLCILIVHSQLPIIRMPVKNTDQLEAQSHHFLFPMINSANTHMIQFFFTLGGMVFALSCLNHFQRHPEFRVQYFIEKLLRRLVRLLPAYAFVILFQASWYKRIKRGPLEYKFEDYCSETWWTNILFVNNYILPTKPCLKFGWYLGADFQLFLIGSLVFVWLWKYPHKTRSFSTAMAVLALTLPGYAIYAGSTSPTMSFDMRHALTELRSYDYFLNNYLPSHTNISGYFFGMIAAISYKLIVSRNDQDRIQPTLRRLLNVSLIALFGLNAFTTVLPYVNVESRKSIFNAVYGSLLKASWGCSYGLIFVVLATKAKSRFVDLLAHPVMQFLAKISYSVYIVQYSVIYGLYTNVPIPIFYGQFNMILLSSAIFLLTMVCALVLHVAVEAPMTQIGNLYITRILTKFNHKNETVDKHSKQL